MHVKVYVPVIEGDDLSALLKVEDFFCSRYGGCTTYPATGSWRPKPGVDTEMEYVNVVECYTDKPGAEDDTVHLRNLSAQVARDLSQECILFVLNDTPHLIPNPEKGD